MRKMLLVAAGVALLGIGFVGCAQDQNASSNGSASMTDTNTCKGCGMTKADCTCGTGKGCGDKCDHCGMGK